MPDGSQQRSKPFEAPLSPGRRPNTAVVTSRALFRFDGGELTLAGLAPGVEKADALAGFAWSIPSRPELTVLPPFPADAGERFPFLWA